MAAVLRGGRHIHTPHTFFTHTLVGLEAEGRELSWDAPIFPLAAAIPRHVEEEE